MRARGADVSFERSSRSSQPLEALLPVKGGPAPLVDPLLDGWDRQDGYHRQLAITVSPMALSSYGGMDGSSVSFSSFLVPLVRPPFAVLPADPQLLVPMFAISESESLLPLTDPTSTPTSGVATRLELARHADATFESVTGKTKAEVQLPPALAQPTMHHAALSTKQSHSASQLEQSDMPQRKRRRTPSPSPARPAAVPYVSTDFMADDRRRAKHSKLNDALTPTHSSALSSIDELTPRNGRHVSAGKATSPATSPSAALSRPRGQSRERSSSRARAFEREHNPPVSSLHMPEHTERAWAGRKRHLQQEQLAADVDSDDDTDTLEQLVYPTAFTLLRRQRRRFILRMTAERNRMHDMWMNLCHRIRSDQDARAMEDIQEDVQQEAAVLSPTPDTSSVPDLATADHEHKSRRRRERSHVTLHANDWMKADFRFVKQDIDSVKRAILEAEATELSVVSSPKSRSTTPAISPASSPQLIAMNGKVKEECKADSNISLADIRAELAHSNPPSPTPSLISLSPPSSRSVSPLPSLRTQTDTSTDTSPAHDDMSPHSAMTDFPALPDSQLGVADKQALRSLAQPHVAPAGKGGCLVEAIISHRQLHRTPAVKHSDQQRMTGDRAYDWHKWRAGIACEYLVQWVESEERTWERADQLQASMINAYWEGRGQKLWDEKDISELHRILKAHMRQSSAVLPLNAT